MGALAGYGFSVIPTSKVKVIADVAVDVDVEIVKPDIQVEAEVVCKDS